MKDRLVIFSSNGAYIETDPPRIRKYLGRPNTLFNPDLSGVEGHRPSEWALYQGRVIPRSARPQEIFLENRGPATETSSVSPPENHLPATPWYTLKSSQVTGALLLGALAMYLAHLGRILP